MEILKSSIIRSIDKTIGIIMAKKKDEREHLKGNISQIGKAMQVDAAGNETETNIMTSPLYDMKNVNTIGLRNVGGYPEKRAKRSPIADVTIETISPNAFQIEGEGITKGDILEHLNTTPATLRLPRILAFDKDISASDANNVLIEANNKIIMNNIDKNRADTLNIVPIPKEELERKIVLGAIQEAVFGKFGVLGKEISPEKLTKNARLLMEYKNKLELEQEKLRKDPKNVAIQQKIGKIRQEIMDQIDLPEDFVIEHPLRKGYNIKVKSVMYDILHDDMGHGDHTSSYDKDQGKILIDGAIVNIIKKKDNTIVNQNVNLTNPIEFEDNEVNDIIIDFVPPQTDLREIHGKTKDGKPIYGEYNYIGSGTAKIGKEIFNKPHLSEKLNKLLFENNDPDLKTWLERPENSVKLKHYLEQLEANEKSERMVSLNQCPIGSVPIQRKASPNAWGMTPKQKICNSELIEDRMGIQEMEKARQIDLINDDINAKKRPKLANADIIREAEQRTKEILDNDPNYKKIVGCDTEEELTKVQNIESQIREGNPDIDLYRVPMRFPTKNANNTTYCKSYKNIIPNVDYELYEGGLTPRQIEAKIALGQKPEKLDTPNIILQNKPRKKKQLLIKQDIDRLVND